MGKLSEHDGRPQGVVEGGWDAVAFGPAGQLRSVESFDDFYRRSYAGLLVLARALVGPSAEDVAQEAMLVAYRKWGDVAQMASPSGWVRRVCMNHAISMLRRRGLEQRLLRRSAPPAVTPSAADDVAGNES